MSEDPAIQGAPPAHGRRVVAGQRLYFENAQCLACGTPVLYNPDRAAFEIAGSDHAFQCVNATECDCNWIGQADQPFCRACALNKIIPDLSIDGNRRRWTRVEAAKKRAIYTLLAFGLPVGPKVNPEDEIGIAFDFLADPIGAGPGGERILTGHDNGLITLNVAEADSPEREKMRVEMRENYRTLLGHFRHELGHYYWDRLVRDDPIWLNAFRTLFGDETADYEQALQAHYANGAPPDWQANFISTYASCHPAEDFAECWAHFFHIVDTLETARAFGLNTDPKGHEELEAEITFDPYRAPNAARLVESWIPLSVAMNAIQRSMGQPDSYPFVLPPPVVEKLDFINRLIRKSAI